MQIAQELERPLPVARRQRLIVKELPDETLIYDLDSDEAHCLNQTAALVWKNCDGTRSARDLASLLSVELGRAFPEEVVWLALDKLQQFELLSEPISRPPHLAGISRRQLIRTLGIAAAVSIPAIITIVAPSAVQAASCGSLTDRNLNCPCSFSAQCASGCCRDGACKNGVGSCS